MKTWWHNLSQREQTLIGLGTAVLGVCVLYFFIWAPLSQRVNSLRNQVHSQTALVQWMHYSVRQINKVASDTTINPQPVSAADLLSTTDSSLKTNALKQYVVAFNQNEPGKITIKFNAVPFDTLSQWFTTLWQNYQIKTLQFNITPTPTKGLVAANVIVGLGY